VLRSLLSPTAGNLEHLVDLRLGLEGLGVQGAIGRGTKVGLKQARSALARLVDSVGETSTWIAADTVFHATVVGLAGNPVLTALYEQVHTSLLEYEYEHWVEGDRVHVGSPPGRRSPSWPCTPPSLRPWSAPT